MSFPTSPQNQPTQQVNSSSNASVSTEEKPATEEKAGTTRFTSSEPLPQVADGDGGGNNGPSASDLAFGETAPTESSNESMEVPDLAAETTSQSAEAEPQGETKGETKKETAQWQSVKVPLSDATRAAVRAAYNTYVKTGKFPPMEDVKEKLSLDWIQVAGPMDRARAQMLYPTFYISENPTTLLPKLVGLGALPSGKSRGAAREPTGFIRVTSKASVYRDLRVGRNEKTGGGGGSRLDTGASSDSLTWIWNLLKGDFNKDPDTAQTVINGIAGLIPVLDQVLDARDLTANLSELVYEGKYNEVGPWFNFVTTLIGAVPEVGSVIKTVARLGAKGVANVGGPMLRAILEWADSPRLAGWVMRQAQESFQSVMSNLELVLATAGRVSDSAKAWVTKLLDNARAALAQLAKRAEAALRQVKQRLDELLGNLRKADEGDAPNAPKNEPSVPPNRETKPPTKKPERADTKSESIDTSSSTKPKSPNSEPTKSEPVTTTSPSSKSDTSPSTKSEPVDTTTSKTDTNAKTDLDDRFKYEDGIRMRDKDSGFWYDRDGFLVDKDARRVDKNGRLLDDDGKPLPDQSLEALTPRQKFEKKFAQVFGDSAVAYRGILLKKGEQVRGTAKGPLGDGQMASFDVDTAMHYAMTPGGAFDEAADEIVIVRIQVKAEHLNPMYEGDLNHVFVKPDVDITQLPGYDVKRLPKPKDVDELPKSADVTKEFDRRAAPQIQ